MQCERPLEGPVPDNHHDVVDAGLPQHVVDLIRGVARNIVAIDLKDLVTKSEIIQGYIFSSIQRKRIIIELTLILPGPRETPWPRGRRTRPC